MQDLAKTKINIKSPAKINLHLEVIGKREDGFHELAMIMQNIDLADYLEFEINNEGLIKLESDCNDLSLSDDNLIVKSANLLRQKSNVDYGANIFLRKNPQKMLKPLPNEQGFRIRRGNTHLEKQKIVIKTTVY